MLIITDLERAERVQPHRAPLITAANRHPVVLSALLRLSHWQQDVEEADTSAICNKTFPSTRSTRPAAAPREWVLSVCSSL